MRLRACQIVPDERHHSCEFPLAHFHSTSEIVLLSTFDVELHGPRLAKQSEKRVFVKLAERPVDQFCQSLSSYATLQQL